MYYKKKYIVEPKNLLINISSIVLVLTHALTRDRLMPVQLVEYPTGYKSNLP